MLNQVTSNHVHLLVLDRADDAIERSMQLIGGCVGCAYNRRKRRRGAFWEDCYHATAVDTDEHLARCFTYIDLNMVRAGVVEHPRQWRDAGYQEIQKPPARFRIIDREALSALLGVPEEKLAAVQNQWIEAALESGRTAREAQWSEALAVGQARVCRARAGRARHARVVQGRGGRRGLLGAARPRIALRGPIGGQNGRAKIDMAPRFERMTNRSN